MASVENSPTIARHTDASEGSNEGREISSAQPYKSIQDGCHVTPVFTSLPQQNPLRAHVPSVSAAQVVSTNSVADEEFPALQNTTTPIPSSVFSYRFASPTSNQTPYYVSSDIVLSGGIAQQTRRRIVHNEVERRRKDKINNWIFRLADIVPQCNLGKQSKNIVLEKTVDYIKYVNSQMKSFNDLQQREQSLAQEVQQLKTQIGAVVKENGVLRDLLQKHRISLPSMFLITPNTSPILATVSKEVTNDSVTIATVPSSTSGKTETVAVATSPNTSEIYNKADAAVLAQIPSTSPLVTTATVCYPSGTTRRESVAYVTPFIIGSADVTMATNTASVSTSPVSCPVVQVAVPSQLESSENIQGQAGFSQSQRSATSRSEHQSIAMLNQDYRVNPTLEQATNTSVYPSSQQTLQTVHATASSPVYPPSQPTFQTVHVNPSSPVYPPSQQTLQTVHVTASSPQVIQSQAGFSQHSVAAIMNVSSQPGAVISAVNTAPMAVASAGQVMASMSPCVVNSQCVSQTSNGLLTYTSPVSLGANNFVTQNTDVNSLSVSQALPTFLVTAIPNQNLAVAVPKSKSNVDQNSVASLQLTDQGLCLGTNQTDGKTKKQLPATNKVLRKPGMNSRNQTSREASKQSKTVAGNGKNPVSNNKRGSAYLPVTQNASKRTCSSQEPQVNMDICRQEEILNIQNFSVSALIPSLDAQTSAAVIANVPAAVATKSDCRKSTSQVSNIGVSQTGQVSRLSHSIESLAGLSRSIGQPQPSTPQQQASHLGPGTLSFSAESLLASSEDMLSNIPHITTTSVSESSQSQQCHFTMAVGPSLHDPSSEQTHQSFTHYSAGSLIGGSDLLGDSVAQVITQESQKQSQPSRTTYSDFSAESLIGSSDLNSGLSYAIDNLISSRSDPSYNSTAMVSVNPNLIHSVKSGLIQEAAANPLRALAAMPDLVEQKAMMPTSTCQSAVLYNGTVSNCSLGLSPPPSGTVSFSFINAIPNNRHVKDNTGQQTGVGQFSNVANNSAASTSFLKHSVDSITSSFYTVGSLGASFSAGSNPAVSTTNSLHGNSFGMESLSNQYPLTLGNPFSPTKSFLGQGSTMGSFV